MAPEASGSPMNLRETLRFERYDDQSITIAICSTRLRFAAPRVSLERALFDFADQGAVSGATTGH